MLFRSQVLKSAEVLEAALGIDSSSYQAHLWLGLIRLAQKRILEAAVHIEFVEALSDEFTYQVAEKLNKWLLNGMPEDSREEMKEHVMFLKEKFENS